ncbi:MAG: hypothetical protein IIY82_06680, partial [Firmicutes bacterium]|nr:hypothetical protein [Bacillota bacterium]
MKRAFWTISLVVILLMMTGTLVFAEELPVAEEGSAAGDAILTVTESDEAEEAATEEMLEVGEPVEAAGTGEEEEEPASEDTGADESEDVCETEEGIEPEENEGSEEDAEMVENSAEDEETEPAEGQTPEETLSQETGEE